MQLWKRFKFGIFDVDGTIFDNMGLSADAFLKTIADFKLPGNETRKIYLETNGMNLDDQLKLVFDKYGVRYDDPMIKSLHDEFFDLRDNPKEWQNSPLFPGVKGLLEKLDERKVKNFISSGSNADEIKSRLRDAGIDRYFALVLGGNAIPKGQKHFEEFAKYCGVSTEEFMKGAFFLSDGANDMELAKKAGIFAIGVTNTLPAEKLKSAGATRIISSADDLIKIEI